MVVRPKFRYESAIWWERTIFKTAEDQLKRVDGLVLKNLRVAFGALQGIEPLQRDYSGFLETPQGG